MRPRRPQTISNLTDKAQRGCRVEATKDSANPVHFRKGLWDPANNISSLDDLNTCRHGTGTRKCPARSTKTSRRPDRNQVEIAKIPDP